MKQSMLWIFLMTAPLVSASSLGTFEAECDWNGSSSGCSGSFHGTAGTFGFGGPFPDGGGRVSYEYNPNVAYNPIIDFGIGTHGGAFTFGDRFCDYDNALHGPPCDAEVSFGADVGPPEDKGLPLGDVVNVVSQGTAQGFFDWGRDPARPDHPVFDLDVTATYQFTLTDPGTSAPFTWTEVQISSISPVPEPGTLLLASLGLVGMAAGLRGRG